MPGVPRELDRMLDEQVLPRIERELLSTGAASEASEASETSSNATMQGVRTRGRERLVVRAVLLRTFGLGESTLEAELMDLARDGDVDLGFRTAFPDNFLRPVARAKTSEEADQRIAAVTRAIRERLGPIVYGEGSDTMESVVGVLLRERGLTLATAESCTGGLIAERITDVPGSSDYFLGGIVAYSNAVKVAQLGVSEAVLASEGAVSEPVVRAMAEGVRSRFGSDFGVATSGISGPDGGTAEKPVGLVWIAIASAAGTHSDSFVFQVDRTRHRRLTAQVALDWIRRSILGAPLVGPTLLRRGGGSSAPSEPSKPSRK
jgi:nicotinamide-nucleotide amidase